MAMALEQTAANFRHLPAHTNAILELLLEIRSLYAVHLTSGHIPKYPEWFDADKHLRVPGNPYLEGELQNLNSSIDEAMQVMATLPETSGFKANFLNPAWQRDLAVRSEG